MIPYNPKKATEEAAERLYLSAKFRRYAFPAAGVFFGGGIGYAMFNIAVAKFAGLAVGTALGGYIGYQVGDGKAIELESQAQLSMIMAKIEENTRNLKPDEKSANI